MTLSIFTRPLRRQRNMVAKSVAVIGDQRPTLEGMLQACLDRAERAGDADLARHYAALLMRETAIGLWPQEPDRGRDQGGGSEQAPAPCSESTRHEVLTCGPVTLAGPEDWDYEVQHSEPLL